MKIQRFNENLAHGSIEETEKYLMEKYNDDIEEYTVRFINEKGDDLYMGGGDSNLDNAVNALLLRKNQDKSDKNNFYYIIKATSKMEVIPNEELERMIDAKKYNL